MKNRDRNFVILFMAAFICIALFFIEVKPYHVRNSSVFTTELQTEMKLYVVMNTFLPVDEEAVAEEIILENQRINGARENTVYEINLYRTSFHYRRNWEYDTIICDENGAIICCGDDLGV